MFVGGTPCERGADVLIAIVLASAMAWNAGRTIYSGRDLLAACSAKNAAIQALCKGYIDATISTAMMYRAISYEEHHVADTDQNDLLCPSGGGLSLDQEIAAIGLYVVAHPEAADAHAPISVVNGLTAAYPCRKP